MVIFLEYASLRTPPTLDASLHYLPSLIRKLFRLQCLVWARLGATLTANKPERILRNSINSSLCGAATLYSVLSPHLKSRSQHAYGPSCTAVWIQFAMSGPWQELLAIASLRAPRLQQRHGLWIPRKIPNTWVKQWVERSATRRADLVKEVSTMIVPPTIASNPSGLICACLPHREVAVGASGGLYLLDPHHAPMTASNGALNELSHERRLIGLLIKSQESCHSFPLLHQSYILPVTHRHHAYLQNTFGDEKIYPDKGKLVVRGDSAIFHFQNCKIEFLFFQRKHPRRNA